MKQKMLILSGVSGSGKTTAMKELLDTGAFKNVLQFTTREPRSDDELDDYVFLDVPTYWHKLNDNHFANFQRYCGNYYAISRYWPTGCHIVVILDNVGKAQVEAEARKRGLEVTTMFINVKEETFKERLKKRGTSDEEVERRLSDFHSIRPNGYDIVVSGEGDKWIMLKRIAKELKKHGFH